MWVMWCKVVMHKVIEVVEVMHVEVMFWNSIFENDIKWKTNYLVVFNHLFKQHVSTIRWKKFENFKFISVPMIFWIILLISFIIFGLLFKKPDDDFHRIIETCC